MGKVNELKDFTRGQLDSVFMKIGQDVGMGTEEGIRAFLKGELEVRRKLYPAEEEKFVLLADLGSITVPKGYVHTNWLSKFRKQFCRESLNVYNINITDCNFSNPTRILEPGDKLHVRVYGQVTEKFTVFTEYMKFLFGLKAVYVGAQGMSLVYEQKRNLLPKDIWLTSFDEQSRLLLDYDENFRVPQMRQCITDGSIFDLGILDRVYGSGSAFLCFTELTEEEKLRFEA